MTEFRINVVVDPGRAQRGTKAVEKSLRRVDDVASRLRKTIARVFAFVGITFLARQVALLTDEFTNLQNRLRVVTEGQAQLGEVTQQVFEVAQATRVAFRETAELYSRTALATRDLGIEQQQLVGFTKSVNQAIILSGASAKEANNGLIQLSQGIASNRLAGDELRSTLEQLPVVADVIAKRLKITRGELRDFAETGDITAKIILEAFQDARQELEDEFAKSAVPTLAQSFVVLRNSIVEFVGQLNEGNGTTRALGNSIRDLATEVQSLAQFVVILAVGFATLKLAPLVAGVAQATAAFVKLRAVVFAGNAVLLGSVEAARQQAFAELAAADATAVNTAVQLANARAVATKALVVRGATQTDFIYAAAQKQIAAATAANTAAQNALAAATARAGTAMAATTIKARLLAATFAVNPFVILIAGAVAAVFALKGLDDALDGIEEAQAIADGGARSGLTAYGQLGQTVEVAKQSVARYAAEVDRSNGTNQAAVRQLEQAENTLARATKAQDDFAAATGSAAKAVREQAAAQEKLDKAFALSIDLLEEERDLLRLSSLERGVQAELLKQIRTLEKDGTKVDPNQRATLENRIRANQILRQRADLLDSVKAPQEEFNRNLVILKDLLAQGEISQVQFNNALAELNDNLGGFSEFNLLLETQRSILEDLRGPQRDYEAGIKSITALLLLGIISTEEFTRKQKELKDELAKSGPERGTTGIEALNALSAENELLKFGNAEREIQAEKLRIVNALIEDGFSVSEGAEGAIESQVRANAALRLRADLLDEIKGPEEERIARQAALLELLALEPEHEEAIRQALLDLQLQAAETGTTVGDGLTRAFIKIREEAQDLASVMENALSAGVNRASDALTEFVTTGQLDFKKFASSLIADIARMISRLLILQALEAAFPGLGAAAGAAGAIPGKAAGGPVGANKPFIVGEEGPELFIPNNAGNVVPNDVTAGMFAPGQGGTTVVTTPAPQVNVSVVNVTDPQAAVAAMDSREGDKVILNALGRNKEAAKRLVT